ncbi:glycosyltransferase [Anaerosacchariphilus polymeriproducens]|uniref:Spore protein YkvP/CgeB glycosyl transferase-like domain-containing protein n=1 Tax=Anaerosacchariphilus polymeriproducens TaxID=1812858 RepID=A0A371AZ07_9FIRM|nr:glycosyltransferase [Anaerosacchariphilus polymeriproducens]RDU24797.1 hypothetical protein DWV06_02135 [Anaerosacchariphilus polymeriproducens]
MIIKINYPYYNSEHSSQIITGFILNKDKYDYTLRYQYKPELLNEFHNNKNILEILLGDKRIIIDTDDGYNIASLEDFDNCLDNLDYYFKRSFRSSYHTDLRNQSKIYPLGLNYYVTCKDNPLNKPGWGRLPLKDSLKKLVRYIPKTNVSYSNFYKNRFELLAKNPPDKEQILFITRLWDNHDIENTMRINCVQALRSTFKDTPMICGFINSPLAQKLCPELILDQNITKKNNYLNLVQSSTICVTTTGLYDSIGWKFAEYVAAGKAIVSEPLLYELPGKFNENENYLSFHDSKTCVKAIEQLLNYPSLRKKMSDLNITYYNNHLAPEILIESVLQLFIKS